MLHTKAFGPRGEDAPLPAWTEDRERFISWATWPLGRPDWAPKPQARTPSAQEMANHEEHVWGERSNLELPALAWAVHTQESAWLGWGTARLKIQYRQGTSPKILFHHWFNGKWNPVIAEKLDTILHEILALLGLCKLQGKDSFLLPYQSDFLCDEAPWEVSRMFAVGGYLYRTNENTNGLSTHAQGITQEQYPAFVAWLKHRFRKIASQFPEIRHLVAILRNLSDCRKMDVDYIMRLWEILAENPSASHQNLMFSCLAAQKYSHRHVQFDDIKEHSFNTFSHKPHWSALPFAYEENHRSLFQIVKPVSRHAYQKSLTIPPKQASRLVAACLGGGLGRREFLTSPTAILELLLVYNLPIPHQEKLVAMMKSPHAFKAWLLTRTPWLEQEQKPWPNESLISSLDPNTYKNFFIRANQHKKEYKGNPEKFTAMAFATIAWLKHTSISKEASTYAQELDVLNQLQEIEIPEPMLKECANKNMTWKGVVNLLQRLQQKRLAVTEDFSAETLDSEGLGWSTALGTIMVDDVTIYPMCRPSHLGLMGDVLNNCTAPGRALESFAERARQGSHRFFRLSKAGSKEFLLSLQKNENQWEVDQLRGRNNHQAPEQLWAVARRVAELYTLLDNVTLKAPGESKDEKDQANDSDSLVDVITEIEVIIRDRPVF